MFCTGSSIVAAPLSFCRNTHREQGSRGTWERRKADLEAQEIRRARGIVCVAKTWACFPIGMIYYDRTPASRWIIEELRRQLARDDVLCPQSGGTVWNQFLLCSPARSCNISPRHSPGVGGTTQEEEAIWARGRISCIMGHFSGSLQFPQQKDFPAGWTCPVCATSALWAEWKFHPRNLSTVCSTAPGITSPKRPCSQASYFPFSIVSSRQLVFKTCIVQGSRVY